MTISDKDLRFMFKAAIEATLDRAHKQERDVASEFADELRELVSMSPYDALGIQASISETDDQITVSRGNGSLTLTWESVGKWWATASNAFPGPVSGELFDLLT